MRDRATDADVKTPRQPVIWLLGAILSILLVATLRAAGPVILPVVAAVFLAMAVSPVDFAVRSAMPRGLRWVGHALAMLLALLILAAFCAALLFAARQAVSEMPEAVDQLDLSSLMFETSSPAASGSSMASGDSIDEGELASLMTELGLQTREMARELASKASNAGLHLAQSILGTFTTLMASIVLVFFLTLLMLIEAPRWRDKLGEVVSEGAGEEWNDAIAVIATNFRWYLVVRTALSAFTATLYGLWLFLLGVDLVAVWWVLAFLLTYVPTLGSIVAAALPILYALLTMDVETVLLVAAGLIVIEQVTGNYLDPRIQGKQIAISPLVTFLALLFFGWLWGVAGALLAVPLAMLLMIAFAHTPPLRFLALFMSDRRSLEGLRESTHR